MESNVKKNLKRWLKRKVTITLGIMVGFMINGIIIYSDELVKDSVIIEEKDGKIVAQTFDGKNVGVIKNDTWINDGIIKVDKGIGVEVKKNISISLRNNGIISGKEYGISNYAIINFLDNNGLINDGVRNGNLIEVLDNDGVIKGSKEITGGNGINNFTGIITTLNNNGLILGVNDNKNNCGIYNGAKIDILNNNGKIVGNINGINNMKQIDKLNNNGIITGKKFGLTSNGKITTLNNLGIISGEKAISSLTITTQKNYGLLINGAGTDSVTVNAGSGGEVNLGVKENPNNRFVINTIEKTDDFINLSSEQAINVEKINSKLDGNDSYKLSDNSFKNIILNGYGTTLKVSGDLSLDNSIINGGVDEVSATIQGSENEDNLTLVGNSIINGNINLGAGDDKLIISDTVQINGDLIGDSIVKSQDNDRLDFISSNNQDGNINLYHKVSGFENINVATDVTLFESAKVTDADNITIEKDGNLILRIDGANNNSHALSENVGTISSEGGKLLLALNGVGEGATIDFGNNKLDESIKGNEIGYTSDITLDTTSLLHNLTKGEGNSVVVNTVEDLPTDFMPTSIDYSKLNSIYQSMRVTDQVKEFDVTDDKKLSGFISYLNDIYAGNPYSFSSTLSRKSVSMFSDVVMGRDLHPEVNKWAIYGGLTHIDGGTKDTYYGKGYYTYDIGSKDIDVDSKITGMYAQGEYGVSNTLNLGVIFGGNQAESEINNNSKVEGDSFYLGAYAKKYLGNLRLLAGVGYQYGDYEADRVAVGYEGITTTRTFDSNYNDNTFNIYAQAKYSNKLANNLYLEPSVALDYTYINQDGTSEDGVLAIETEDKDFSYTTVKFGVDLRKDIPTTTATHSLVAGAYYNRMLDGDDEKNITGRFKGGNDFDISVSPSNKHELGLRAKYEIMLDNGVTFDIKGSYMFERENHNGAHENTYNGEWTVGGGIGYKF